MKPIYITSMPSKYKIQFEYNAKLIEVIKRVPSKPRYDGADKAWLIVKDSPLYPPGKPAEWYVHVFAQWAVQNRYCEKIVEREIKEEITFEIPEMTPLAGEHYMLLKPYNYQLEGVAYALNHKRCIFGDQPGLGKTLQAICAVVKAHKERAVFGESFPCLVICPASLKVNWKREFKKFSGMDAIILDDRNRDTWQNYIMMKRQDGESCCSVFITNYESLKKFFVKKVLPAAKLSLRSIIFDERINLFKTVIIDESHKCKTSKTQQSKYVEGICKGKKFVFALTGTPVVNDNTDLVQQLKILNKLEDFGGYTHFMKRFCDGPKRSSNTRELNWRLWNSCFFRREKQKVLTELPEKTRQYIICDISTRQEYETCEMDLIKYLRQYKNANDEEVQRAMRGEVMVRMGKLKAIAARGKIKAVADFVHDIIDGGEKLILFAYLKDVVLEMKKHFPDAVTVTGSDTIEQKQIAVDRFQTDPDTRLIILNYKSGGTGLTLTASSRVAFIEFPWTYADCEQAEDRAHRNGQKNNVNCYYFLGENTIDKDMYELIQTKRSIADGVTGTTTQIDEDMVNITMNLFKDKL